MINPLERAALIIPALNEAENLAAFLPTVNPLGFGQVIVGDNGSTDATADVARAYGAHVAHEPRRGYGAACFAGMLLLREEIDVVVFIAADMSDDVTLAPALVEPVACDECDLVIGTRDHALREPGAMSLPQRLGDRLATRLIRFGWGYDYRDLGPFRAIRRSSLFRMDMRDRAFGWTLEMQVRAVEMNLRIRQVPVPYRRGRGRSKIGGSIPGILRAGRSILTTWWRLHRKRRRPRHP